MDAKILVVEDDTVLQKVIVKFLQNEGFVVDSVATGSDALVKIERSHPALVLLDLGLPDMQGETVLREIRQNHEDIPIVILTAKSKPHEIAEGLNLGADDYLPKPFAAEELLARINARMGTEKNVDELKVSDLSLDLRKMEAKRKNKKIELTKTEFELLKYMLLNAGQVLSREMILNHVWGYSSNVESRVVDVYVGYLRKKVDAGFSKKLIVNKRGFGYLIEK